MCKNPNGQRSSICTSRVGSQPTHGLRKTAKKLELVEDVETDGCNAFLDHAELFGRCPGQIDYTTSNKRASIVYPHFDRATVAEVGDADSCVERQGPVRGREFPHVIPFAAGRYAAVVWSAVPRRFAHLVVCRTTAERHAAGREREQRKKRYCDNAGSR